MTHSTPADWTRHWPRSSRATQRWQVAGNVFLPTAGSGLDRDSVVNVTAFVTLDKADVDTRVRHLPDHLMAAVDDRLRLILDLLQSAERPGLGRLWAVTARPTTVCSGQRWRGQRRIFPFSYKGNPTIRPGQRTPAKLRSSVPLQRGRWPVCLRIGTGRRLVA